MSNENEKNEIVLGAVTILVSVGGTAPLSLTGTIEKIGSLERHSNDSPIKVKVEDTVKVKGELEEEEEFIIMDVTSAILPTGFPLTIAQLTEGDVAINLDFVILILPVEVV